MPVPVSGNYQPGVMVCVAMNISGERTVFHINWSQVIQRCLLFTSLITPSLPALADQQLKLNIGAEYTTGDYGGTDTVKEWYLPVTLRYSSESWVYRITVPYLHVTAPSGGELIGYDLNGIPIYSGATGEETEEGLGDIIASIKYAGIYKNLQLGLLMDVTAKVKLATADEDKALGTGENDYSAGIDFIKRDKPYSTLFGLLYTLRGDSPDLDIRDTYSAYIGVVRDMTDKLDLGIVYAYGRSAFSEQDDLQELDLDISYRFTTKTSVRLYGIIGLSEGSPDLGAGLTVGFTLM